MYVQHAPLPVQASLVSPAILASNMNQLKDGGAAIIIANIIKRVKAPLKLLVFIFLFNKSRYLRPENSILIRCRPNNPIISGNKRLTGPGK